MKQTTFTINGFTVKGYVTEEDDMTITIKHKEGGKILTTTYKKTYLTYRS